MDSPAIVAMPLPMCRPRSGSFALQGTSLEEQRFRGQCISIRELLPLALETPLQKHTQNYRDTNERLKIRTGNTIE